VTAGPQPEDLLPLGIHCTGCGARPAVRFFARLADALRGWEPDDAVLTYQCRSAYCGRLLVIRARDIASHLAIRPASR
jgi:hypothetical protein